MKASGILLLVGLAFIFVFSSLAYAAVPQMINYQGKITTPAGALVDTTVQMIFTIYDDSTTGTALWADTQSTVVVEKGVFSVLLGSSNPIPDSVFDGNIRYLGTKVGGDPEMSPRKAMVSVAYAYRAGTADGGGGNCGWVDDGAVVRLETGTDKVGIGTSSPGADLDIVSANPNLRVGTTSGTPVITLDKASGNWGYLEFRDAGASKWQAGVTTGNDYYILNWPSSKYVFYANSAGDVGIGTTSPSEQLTVNGDIDMIQGQSRIHGIAEMSFDWTAGSTYDNPSQHGIESKNEAGSWGDEIRINSMNDIINTLDANDNMATSYFKVQHHSTGDGEDLFWVRSSDGYAYHKSRLGIGTTSPGVDLDIVSANPNLRLSTASGTPVITLDKASGNWGYLEFREGGSSKWQAGVTSGNDYYILNWPSSKYVFYANSAGDVGIGTTSPSYKLDVNGDINVAGSYNVKKGGTNYTHPDYVFESSYELMPIAELKKYVSKRKCLPNVISAEDVKKNNGFKMDELLIQMLEKIEEQTLYIFQLEERIVELEKKSK